MLDNQTLDLCPEDHRYDLLLKLSRIIWRFFGLSAILLGIPGHIFHILILSNRFYPKSPQSLYRTAISVCELIFLLGGFWFWSITVGLTKIDPRQVLSCGIFYSLIIGSSGLSNIYLALMCINRTMMILWPLQYRARVKQVHVRFKIYIVAIMMILSLVPHHFYLYYNQKTTFFLCEYHSSVGRRGIRLWSLTHAAIYVSIPMLIVGLSSFILLINRYRHHQLHKNNQSVTAARMLNRSILITFFSVGLGLSVMPACILQIFIVRDQLFLNDGFCSIRWKIYKISLNCFLVLSAVNYSMKFYIHLIISRSFREHFRHLLTCQVYRQRISMAMVTIVKKEEEKMIPISSS